MDGEKVCFELRAVYSIWATADASSSCTTATDAEAPFTAAPAAAPTTAEKAAASCCTLTPPKKAEARIN